MTRMDYEERQNRRRQRLEERAAKAAREAESAGSEATRLLRSIPPGQPILIGHHSERRHRAALERIDRRMRKALDEQASAERLRAAASAVGSGGISSDDPEAISKLERKLLSFEEEASRRKALNAAWRKAGKPLPNDPDGWGRVATLVGIPLDQLATLRMEMAKRWHFQPGAPYLGYALSNANAEIRRLRARIESLRGAAVATTQETHYGDVRVVENVEENRIQIFFPEKPEAEMRTFLKQRGFRWSPSASAWQRHLSDSGRLAAECVVDALKKKEVQDGTQ